MFLERDSPDFSDYIVALVVEKVVAKNHNKLKIDHVFDIFSYFCGKPQHLVLNISDKTFVSDICHG